MRQTTEIVCSENLKLRLLTKQDAMPIFEAISTQRNYLGRWFVKHNEPISLAKTKELVSNYVDSKENPTDIIYLILVDDEFVGFIGLKNIDYYNNKAELNCWMQEKYQYRNIMLEAGSRFLEHIFRTVKLNRLEIKTIQENSKLIEFTRRLGFTQEGVEKQGLRVAENKYLNLTTYSMLKSEYNTKMMFYRRSTKLKVDL